MSLTILHVTILALLLKWTWAESCPHPEDILPCMCHYSGNTPDIDVICKRGSVDDIDDVFFQLRGKTIRNVELSNITGGKLPSLLFWDIRVRVLNILYCDLQGLSDSDRRPPFVGLENSLKELTVRSSIRGSNQIKKLDLSHLKNIDTLALISNNIPQMGDDWFANGPDSLKTVAILFGKGIKFGERVFQKLANLTNLRIMGCDLKTLKRTMMPNPALKLQRIYFYDDNLSVLPVNIFSGMPSLSVLELQLNFIRRIPSSTFSSVWENLTFLGLARNPLECDSHIDWMFSVKRPADVLGTCSTPNERKGKNLSEVIDSNRKQRIVSSSVIGSPITRSKRNVNL